MILIVYILGIVFSIYCLVANKAQKKAMLVLLAGSVMAVVMGTYSVFLKTTSNMDSVERGEKGSDRVHINMEVEAFDSPEAYKAGKGSKKDIGINVSPVDYTTQELIKMESKFWKEIFPLIKGDNENLEHVDKPLYFPTNFEGYPFDISWNSSAQRVLNNNGEIGENASEDGSMVEIRAVISVEERGFSAEERFNALIYPEADENAFWKRLDKTLERLEEDSRAGKVYELPVKFEGKYLNYSEKTGDSSGLIFLMSFIAAGAVISAEKKQEEKLNKMRLDAMEQEYPQMVSKMSMLVGAGMTISGAFKKMAYDYGQSGEGERPLYDEMLKTAREVESGVSERSAWRSMGNRCKMPCVIRFCALITQYSQSGASGLRAALGVETDQALKDRKERAKRLGEEAGTKLLFPMVMMLMVVMVVIMIPAFTSFGV